MPTWIIVLAIIAAAVIADVIYLVRRKKSGTCACGHDCSKCGKCCCGTESNNIKSRK